VARPADPPAFAVHRRQPRRRAALSRRPVAARCFPKTCLACAAARIIEGAGHWVQQELPAEVNKLLIDFLKGL
jgi:pimeloyl-ACP methyl ester carboxylesterase